MPRFSSSCSSLIRSTLRYSETSDAATESSGGGRGSFSATDIDGDVKQVSRRCQRSDGGRRDLRVQIAFDGEERGLALIAELRADTLQPAGVPRRVGQDHFRQRLRERRGAGGDVLVRGDDRLHQLRGGENPSQAQTS